MKAKKLLVTMAIVTALTAPFSVYAATADSSVAKTVRGFFRIDTAKLNEVQKADAGKYTQKLADLQKEFIGKMVENGTITKEQGDAEIQRIEAAKANGDINSFLDGRGGKGHGGPGMRGGIGMAGLDMSKLTDQQKADLKAAQQKMLDLQKEYIGKMVANGLLTKEQGDAATKKLGELALDSENVCIMPGKGGFGLFGLRGMDSSKLTDQQKADMDEFSKKMTELHKDMIDKMVANGALTKEQGDAADQRLESGFRPENGFPKGRGMRRGGFSGKGWNNNTNTTQPAITQPSV